MKVIVGEFGVHYATVNRIIKKLRYDDLFQGLAPIAPQIGATGVGEVHANIKNKTHWSIK